MSDLSIAASVLLTLAWLDPRALPLEPPDRGPIPGAGRSMVLAQGQPAAKQAGPSRTRPTFVPLDPEAEVHGWPPERSSAFCPPAPRRSN